MIYSYPRVWKDGTWVSKISYKIPSFKPTSGIIILSELIIFKTVEYTQVAGTITSARSIDYFNSDIL